MAGRAHGCRDAPTLPYVDGRLDNPKFAGTCHLYYTYIFSSLNGS